MKAGIITFIYLLTMGVNTQAIEISQEFNRAELISRKSRLLCAQFYVDWIEILSCNCKSSKTFKLSYQKRFKPSFHYGTTVAYSNKSFYIAVSNKNSGNILEFDKLNYNLKTIYNLKQFKKYFKCYIIRNISCKNGKTIFINVDSKVIKWDIYSPPQTAVVQRNLCQINDDKFSALDNDSDYFILTKSGFIKIPSLIYEGLEIPVIGFINARNNLDYNTIDYNKKWGWIFSVNSFKIKNPVIACFTPENKLIKSLCRGINALWGYDGFIYYGRDCNLYRINLKDKKEQLIIKSKNLIEYSDKKRWSLDGYYIPILNKDKTLLAFKYVSRYYYPTNRPNRPKTLPPYRETKLVVLDLKEKKYLIVDNAKGDISWID